ncbi:hypothetical protein D7Z54_32445 [Salibacterium salarium]|uniref:Uncharacterized protein n=1 Tax=Salibacterium salarium TaxID=284579 RepID=A0A428MSX3_9BACI|nr:hypothetical protein [Salibacterium salarium]RSL29221.1 hypothetical protein D7Z54_32445 [Salibacterium salarium]
MRIERIQHDLNVLKEIVGTIEAKVYANLGRVDNDWLSDEELFDLVYLRMDAFNRRIDNLRIELENERRGIYNE